MTIYHLNILGKPDAKGVAPIIDARTHAGSCDEEAIRTAKESVLASPSIGAYGFSLTRQDGSPVHTWFNTETR